MNERMKSYSALESEFKRKADKTADDQLRESYSRLAASYRELREIEERKLLDKR
jgi:hypothetical protein